MTGTEKRIKDIRYFESAHVPGPGHPLPSNGELLDIPRQAHRLGQRIACVLESEGFSVGAYDHVYIALTPAVAEGQIHITNFGFEPWHRYVAYGTLPKFKNLPEEAKLHVIQTATFAILKALKPDGADVVERAEHRLAETGARTRVLRATKETKAYSFAVWFDVPPLHEKAHLYLTALDKSSGRVLEAPPLPIADFEHAFPLVSTITFSNGMVNLNPRKSFRASFSTGAYGVPIRVPLAQFAARQ